ncbi:MAG: hypothetical protein JWO19_827 [Bryobacterales bacterium]|jgi:hypothetical protein|nr:hypothetical protein [Bryobacterales bacterium]
MPRKKLTPTEEQRSLKTLLKYYKEEIFRGRLEADAKVGKTMLDMACDGQTPVATIHSSKARFGWHDKSVGDVRPAAIPDFIVALEKKAA